MKDEVETGNWLPSDQQTPNDGAKEKPNQYLRFVESIGLFRSCGDMLLYGLEEQMARPLLFFSRGVKVHSSSRKLPGLRALLMVCYPWLCHQLAGRSSPLGIAVHGGKERIFDDNT